MSKRSQPAESLNENSSKKVKQNSISLIDNIPQEVLLNVILPFNEGCELIQMRRINSVWKSLIDHQLNWKEIVKNRLSFLPIDLPKCIVQQFSSENAFWQEYFKCKIAYGKYATIYEFRKKERLDVVQALIENPKEYQQLLFSVESMSQQYCEKLHPNVTIVRNEVDEDYEEEADEDEENEAENENDGTDTLYWKVPLKSMTSGYSIGNADDLIAVGESKIGGWPDLPKNFKWPTVFDQKWMFGCQINIKQLSYYDRTGSTVPTEGGMIYFFCDPNGGGNGSYCAPNRSQSQPVLYLTEKQIKDMGGLERQQGERTYSNAAKMKFHSIPVVPCKSSKSHQPFEVQLDLPLYRNRGMFSLFTRDEFDSDIDIIGEEDQEESSSSTSGGGDKRIDFLSQSKLLIVYSGDQELRSGDQYLWEWGIPNDLIGTHQYYGCAVTSGDP